MNVNNKKYGCKILLHSAPFICADPKVLKHYRDFTFENFIKWKWFFRYLTARYQVENPRKCVELREFSYDFTPTEQEKKTRLINKIRSAKAKITEWRRKIEYYESTHNELFPIENDPLYVRAMDKFRQKENELLDYESQLSRM